MSGGIQISEEFFKKFGKRFPPEAFLCREGEPGETMFFINKGQVAIIKDTPAGDKTLATLKDGDFFGEMALMGAQETRAASVKTVTEVAVLELNRMAFEGMIKRSPEIAMKVIASLTSRVRDSNAKLTALIHKNDFVRVAAYIAHLSMDKGRKADPDKKGRIVAFNCSAASQAIGVDEAEVRRFLGLARKVNFVGQNGDWLWVPHVDYLQPFAEVLKEASSS